jgi:hypothetical protein
VVGAMKAAARQTTRTSAHGRRARHDEADGMLIGLRLGGVDAAAAQTGRQQYPAQVGHGTFLSDRGKLAP